MSKRRNNTFALRIWVTAVCLALPTLTLAPFGGVWLFQHGYALYWVLGACLFVVAAFLFQLYLFRRLDISLKAAPAVELPEDRAASSWTPREQEAWNAVLAVAEKVDLSHYESWQAFLGLGQETIEAVAKSLHPEVEEPLWQFTLPEALTLVEQVSLRLKPMVVHNIPFGDKLTVGQAIRIYQWRSVIDVAQRGYDIWRIIRVLNPATAVTWTLVLNRAQNRAEIYFFDIETGASRLALSETDPDYIEMNSGLRFFAGGFLWPSLARWTYPPLLVSIRFRRSSLFACQTGASDHERRLGVLAARGLRRERRHGLLHGQQRRPTAGQHLPREPRRHRTDAAYTRAWGA